MRRTTCSTLALAAALAAGWASAQQNPLERPAPPGTQNNANAAVEAARGSEGFFRPTDLALNTLPPPAAPAPAPARAPAPPRPAPEVVVNVVPDTVRPEDIARAQIDAQIELNRVRPAPIAGAFTGETSPEKR